MPDNTDAVYCLPSLHARLGSSGEYSGHFRFENNTPFLLAPGHIAMIKRKKPMDVAAPLC